MSKEAAASLSAPAWRQFSFFTSTLVPDAQEPGASPEAMRQPSLISTIAASPTTDLILSADLEGYVNVMTPDYEVAASWRAYGNDSVGGGGRCTNIVIAQSEKWKGIIITLGDEGGSQHPIIKVWDSRHSSVPILLRASKIQHSTRPHPVSSLAVSPDLSHIAIALANGTVLSFRHLDQLLDGQGTAPTSASAGGSSRLAASTALGLGKLRVIYEGKDPITGLAFRVSNPGSTVSSRNRSTSLSATTTLYILTVSQILSIQLTASSKPSMAAKVVEDFGVGVDCSAVIESKDGGRLIVAREEAIYAYGDEGREGAYAYEGPKSGIRVLYSTVSTISAPSTKSRSNYIAIISPPLLATATSTSATLRSYARNAAPTNAANGRTASPSPNSVARVTIFDLENKFIAHTGTFDEGVRDVWESYGSVWILTDAGKLYRLTEQPIATSLSTLFSRNLYTLAVALAQSRKLPPSEIAEIYRRQGDYLYSKSDYEGSMGSYLKTVGTVQPSYVIRKFLDAQRLSFLTSYLQELHSRGLANSDHTTLLLNCYTKLADDSSLSAFIHSSSKRSTTLSDSDLVAQEIPPFDLETAIRVCRQAGYFEHAVWLAERYGEHTEYLRIQIEDRGDFHDSLRYVRKLSVPIAEDSMLRYGKTLLSVEADETTQCMIDLCCGTLAVRGDGTDGANEQGKQSRLAYVVPSTTSPSLSFQGNVSDRLMRGAAAPAIPSLRSATAPVLSDRKSGIDQLLLSTDAATPPSSAPSVKVDFELPSCRQFFASFVEHPHHFISFLETLAFRRWGKKLTSIAPLLTHQPEVPLLVAPRLSNAREELSTHDREEQAIWNTLLELYLSHGADEADRQDRSQHASSSHSRVSLEAKALQLLRSHDTIPYDETQALVVCTSTGFTAGFVLLYERLGMYDDIVRYWIDLFASSTSPGLSDASRKVVDALHRYGPSRPSLYKMVLKFLTTSFELLSKHEIDLKAILEAIDESRIMPPIAVIALLSKNGTASVGLVREYLKKHLIAEKQEIDSDLGLIASYRSETSKHRKDLQELSDPNAPRIFQVTRCSVCSGQLELPAVHFLCRHSYHQRCLSSENEAHCPACARSHGIVQEIRMNNERLAGEHGLFLEEVRESEDGFTTIANAYGRGVII